MSKVRDEKRVPFFEKMLVNPVFCSKNPHHFRMDELIKRCETPFFMCMDDDVIFKKNGLIEDMMSLFDGDNIFIVGETQVQQKFKDKMILPRINPAVLLLRKNLFLQYRMTFKRMWPEDYLKLNGVNNKNDFLIDTAGFLLIDAIKYGLQYKNFLWNKYAVHYGASSYMIFQYAKVDLLSMVKEDLFVRLNPSMFEIKKINPYFRKTLDLIIKTNNDMLDEMN